MLLLLHDFLKFILDCYWQVKLSHLRQLFKDLLIVHLGVIFFHWNYCTLPRSAIEIIVIFLSRPLAFEERLRHFERREWAVNLILFLRMLRQDHFTRNTRPHTTMVLDRRLLKLTVWNIIYIGLFLPNNRQVLELAKLRLTLNQGILVDIRLHCDIIGPSILLARSGSKLAWQLFYVDFVRFFDWFL